MQYLTQLLISGLAIGAIYGLIAMGFAVIYKSTGLVNFAQGEMTMCATDGLVGALDDQAEHDGGKDGAERYHDHVAADRGRDGPGDIGRDHGHFALREIDQAGGLVNDRKTHRDQAVDGADRKA